MQNVRSVVSGVFVILEQKLPVLVAGKNRIFATDLKLFCCIFERSFSFGLKIRSFVLSTFRLGNKIMQKKF